MKKIQTAAVGAEIFAKDTVPGDIVDRFDLGPYMRVSAPVDGMGFQAQRTPYKNGMDESEIPFLNLHTGELLGIDPEFLFTSIKTLVFIAD